MTSHGPDCPDLVHRDTKNVGNTVTNEMRFLRAGPAGDFTILDLDDRTGRTHTSVRLERPLVLGLDDTRRSPERPIDITHLFRFFALARWCLADVIVEPGGVRERRRCVRPFNL